MMSALSTLWTVFSMFGWILIIVYVYRKEAKDMREMNAKLDGMAKDPEIRSFFQRCWGIHPKKEKE